MTTIEDQEYEAKLQDLRRHAPFLKSMIDKLRAQERTQQVSKLESLWCMITSNKRLKFETLQKCEDVMLKIQSKSVAGVNKSVQIAEFNSNNKSEIKSKTPISNKPDKNVAVIMNAVKLNIARAKLHDVVTPTPKSPTPDRDLHQHIPISIPMDKVDIDEIASPDPDDDPICWSETSENRYDSARPDVYTNAVMHKPEEKLAFQSPTPIIPHVLDINTPPISMQDLQQLEDSIPVEKKRDSEPKKEPSETEKLLKRPSKVSLVPAPIIKPKHKKDGEHCNNTKVSATDKSKVKSNDNKKSVDKSSSEASKSKTACVEHKSKASSSAKEHKKSSESKSFASSKITSGKDPSSHKSSNNSSDKSTVDNKSETTKHHHSSMKHSHDKNKDSKHKESKLHSIQHSKTPRSEDSIEDRASTTMFGNLLSSIDNTLLSEKDATSVNKKKVPPKPAVKPKSNLDKSNKLTCDIKLASEVPTTTDLDKTQSSTEDKTVFKRLADKYNPRPKKKEPDSGNLVDSIISAKDSTATCYPNMSPIERSVDIRNSPLLPTPSGPPIFNQQSPLNNLRFSPPSESQFYQKQHYQFNVQQQQQQQRRPSFNRFDVNSCPDNNRIDPPRSSMEYDLSKMGSADFYNNKSPPFNNRPVEPLLNVIISNPPDGFPSWNNRDGHDFQGRKFHPDHPRIDPRLNRQQNVDDTQINRFDNNFDWQGDGNRFFRADDRNSERLDDVNRFCMPCDSQFDRHGDSNRFIRGDDNIIDVNRPMRSDNIISLDRLESGNRFFRQNDTNFDGNRFVRPEDHSLDGSRFVRPEDNIYDGRFVRPEDNTFDGNRFIAPGDNLDRLKDNRPSRFNDNNFDRQGNRFFRPNLTNVDRQGDGNRFVRPDEAKDSIKPSRHQDNTNRKVDGNRLVKSDEKNTSEHDNSLTTVKDKPLSKKAMKITKKQEAGRPDQRVQRLTEQSKSKVESSSPSLAIIKRDALDDLYCRINIKDKDEHESFTSPLDSIYEKKQQVTGKGYGVQNFRIPKKPRPQPVVQKCPTPPPERSPTLSRKRSPSPPLRRPPTPPRKRRTISPTERLSTSPPPPNMNDESMLSTKKTEGIPMPEIVAQLPESIRKDDRFGDVVTVLSSLLKDETALTKIKKLLTKGAKNNVSDDDDDYNLDKEFDSVGKKAAAKKKTRKLVKRQSKKSTITKKTVTKRSSSVNSPSTDTESTQVRRSGRLRKRPIIFDNDEDDDSEDIPFETEKINKCYNDHTAHSSKYQVDSHPALTDEQLDDIASCMDPFDDFLPDNEADQLVEEALKQPAEKLEEEINKQIVNDIFDSLKNDDNILVPAEDTQKIIDSWGLSDANADKIIDAWKIPEPSTENKITEELFDKDERDEEVSQDNQEDVRNEIDELIKNMPLNDSDKILDCDIVKDNDVVSEPIIHKESVKDEIANCDNIILPVTKSGTEEVGGNSDTHLQNDDSIPPESSGEQQSPCVSKVVENKDKSYTNENEIDAVFKPLYTRSLRSSPRVRPPINYADEIKPRIKRLPKKLDTENADCISAKKRDFDVSLEMEKMNEEVNNKTESPKTDKQPEPKENIEDIKVEGANLSASEILHGESIPTINISKIKIKSKQLVHLDLVITEMIAKYSGDIESTIDQSSKILAKKVYEKKAGPKSKLKVLTIQEDVVIKMETGENKEVEKCIEKDVEELLPTNIEKEPHNFTCKKAQKRTTNVEPVEDTVNEIDMEKPNTRNAKKQSSELDTFQNTENKIVAVDSDVTKTFTRKGKKQNTKALVISENITEETSLINDSDTNAEAESMKYSPKREIKKQTNESSASSIEELLLNEYLEPGAENVPKVKGNKQNTKLLENSESKTEASLVNEDVFELETREGTKLNMKPLDNSDNLTAVYTFKEDILDSKEIVLKRKGKKQNTSSSLTEETALIIDTVSSTEPEIQIVHLKSFKKETNFDDNETTASVQSDALAEGKVKKDSINKQTVNPSDSSERISMQDSAQPQDVDSDITATIEAESTNKMKIKSIEASTDIENLSEVKSLNTEASPLKKKKVIIKKRGRPCKSQAVKKKKPLTAPVESTDYMINSEKEQVKKAIGRPRKKRTELDKLHEDIKETLGDKVLISKRTSLKSPRHGMEEIEKTSDKSEESDDPENESGEDTSYSVKQSKAIVSPDPRQKAKGLKVVVEQLPVNKVLPKTAKGKSKKLLTESIRRRTAKQTAQADNNESDSEGNEGSTNSSPETNNQAGNKKRKKRNVWATGFIRSNKKKKIVKSAGDAANQNTEYGAADDSECSDDIDTDYDVEFVEPDSEHYMIKGKPTKCRLCDFEGLTLVDHYVNNHRAGEVPVSRMCPRDSTLAMEEAEENNYYVNVVSEDLIVKDSKKKKVRFSFTCRFCLQEFPQYSNVQFVDHLATHTGEYRHKCGACDLKNANLRFIKTHYEVVHSNSEKEEGSSQVEVIIPPPLNFHTVFGYMCSECHFVQLAYRSVMEHIQIYHLDESATTIKINMSVQSRAKKKCTIADEEPSAEVAMETGVFTSQEIILEEELRRVEETNRTELMNHVQQEVTSSRLSSVAALLKSRFDSPDSQSQDTAESHSPDTSLPDLSLSKEIVRLLPKAKAKESADKKPNLAELSLQSPTLLSVDNATEPLAPVLAQPTNLQKKYTIFIIGPLKAVVTHSNNSVDFACITDDCVFYTTDREDMANHCKQTHDNRSEKIKCGYCTFAGNAVPLLQVFEHICAMHVDPLLVKEEPVDLEKEQQMMEKEIEDQPVEVNQNEESDKDVTITDDFTQFNEVASPSPPRLQFMGNFYGIKITAVTGGVVDDFTPNDINQSIDEEPEKSIDNTNEINNELPQLLPINQQSARVLKKLSNLHNQTKPSTRTTKVLDAITVPKVDKTSNNCATTSSQTATPKTFTTSANDSPLSHDNFCSISNRSITDNDDLMILTPNTNSIPINSLANQHPPPLLLIDDQTEVVEQHEFDSIGDASHILATLAKVSTLPEESAAVSKRRFHTGKTDLLYRCPDAKCGFSSETMKEFELHLRSIGGGHSDLQRMYRCVYCYTMLPLQNYSAHLFYFHGTSEFACSRCCYRAVTPYHIQLHKNSYHHYDQTDIVLLQLAADVSKDSVNGIMMEYTASKLKSLIRPFSCYCGERFIVTASYSLHLEKIHRNDMLQGGVDCRDCQMKGGKNMVAHYAQVHRNYLYHCAYCSFGTNVAAIDVFNHQSTRHPGLPMDVVVRSIATVDPNNTSPLKNNHEDDTIWSKIVRLGNPQATKDLELIEHLREMESTLTSNQQQQQSSILLKPASNKFPIHITTTSKSQPQTPWSSASNKETNTSVNSTKQTKEPSLIRSVIELSVLSPHPIELDSSTVVEQLPDDTISLLESEDNDDRSNLKAPTLLPVINSGTNNFPPEPSSSIMNSIEIDLSTSTLAVRIPPRCVTPTNQPIPQPLLNSPITTPEESIFVVLPSSSEPNSIPLAGSDLFVCAQCGIHCTTSSVFRTHVHDCVKVDREANTKPYGCAHCDKRSKTSGALLDHLRMHGFPRYRCGLCDFKHTQPWNVRNHMKSEHNISTCVQVPAHPTRIDDDFDDFIYRPRQSQLAPSAHNLLTTLPPTSGNIKHQNKDLTAAVGSVDDAVGNDGSGFVMPMQKYLPTQVDKLPMRAVYTTEVGCGLCGYTSKVRTNITRHLKLHTDGLAPTDLPTSACVNPVPCLERDELMFDKMTNLAYNSHQAELNKSATSGRMGGLAAKLDSSASVGIKGEGSGKGKVGDDAASAAVSVTGLEPPYVPCCKRFVCGAVDCNYLCHDESMFRRHIQALHSHSEVSYRCCHCPPEKTSATPAMLNVELVLRHLRLHGSILYKCTYCPFLHNMKGIIDRHVSEKHMEKNVPNSKAIITVRDFLEETAEDSSSTPSTNQNPPNVSANFSTNSGTRGASGGAVSCETTKAVAPISAKDAKPWRCAMCKVRCVTVEDIVNHTNNKHKIGSRYKCGYCDYSDDDRDSYIPHFATHHPDSPILDVITIYFHDPSTHHQQNTANTSAAAALSNNKDDKLFKNDQSPFTDNDASFDTTPLWRKPTTGDVRHIRGILLETRGLHMQHKPAGGGQVAAGIERSSLKRERGTLGGGSEEETRGTDQGGTPLKKHTKVSVGRMTKRTKSLSQRIPTSADASLSQEEVFTTSSLVISIPVESNIRYHFDTSNNLRLKDVNDLSIRKMLIKGCLMGKYGDYGRPTERGYLCPKCGVFETNGERQFVAHLFKEISYMRYQCSGCYTRSTITKTVYLRCPAAPPDSNPPESDCSIHTCIDVSKEQWALMVLAIQTRIAAHLTANSLWGSIDHIEKGGQMEEAGAGANMKGLKLAYGIKGRFHPTDIFPKSPATRYSQSLPLRYNDEQKQSPQKNSRYSLRHNNTTPSPTEDNVTARPMVPGHLMNVFAQVQKLKPMPLLPPVLLPKQAKSEKAAGECKQRTIEGIQMFPEVVTVGEEEKEVTELSDEDEVEIIDPLVDIVDVDACDVQDVQIPEAIPPPAESKPVENVTVSNFLPSLGDDPLAATDPLMDENTPYSDNDSIGLEIAEDDVAEEVEHLQPELSPNKNTALSTSGTTQAQQESSITIKSVLQSTHQEHPITNTPQTIFGTDNTTTTTMITPTQIMLKNNTAIPTNDSIPQTTIVASSTHQCDPARGVFKTSSTDDQHEDVSSTTSDSLVLPSATPSTSAITDSSKGFMATLRPIDPSLVGRLRVIGDASMVGCFGLSSGMSVQMATPLQSQRQAAVDFGGDVGGGRLVVGQQEGKGIVGAMRSSNIVMYDCQHCNFCTSNMQSLKKHEIRHWVEKPYRCGYVYPTGHPCNYQHYYRSYVVRHAMDSHPRLPGKEVPITFVKITNPTIVNLRRPRNTINDQDSTNSSPSDSPISAKRLRLVDDDGMDVSVGSVKEVEEEFVERFTCPNCSYTSHKMRYVLQHLRLHVKCVKCQLCNEKDVLKKRLIDEKCSIHHENIPSRLVIEYDSYELDRLKGLVQKIRVPSSSLKTIEQPQTVDNEEENEFLEVYKTVRSYPKNSGGGSSRTPQRYTPKQSQTNTNTNKTQLITTPLLTTFDIASATYVPLNKQPDLNTLYRIDNVVGGDGAASGNSNATGAPIVLNAFLGSTQQQPTTLISTGDCMLSTVPVYAAANFYTTPTNVDDGDFLTPVSAFRPDSID